MYLSNKYSNWYYSIIDSARSRVFPVDTYTETHHIIPKSLGGKNTPDNLVKLTAREHYICHLLLPKMTENLFKKKMSYALWCIVNVKNSNQTRYKVTSREYNSIKIAHSLICKAYKHTDAALHKISASNKGKVVSLESKKRMSDSAIRRGSTNTAESIAKAKETRTRNNTTNSANSPEANAKRVTTRKTNGALQRWIDASHSPEARKKAAERCRKSYIAITPSGEHIPVSNLKEFCKLHNLRYDSMNAVANNHRTHYNSWICKHDPK
jgi:hypothetical protein